MGRYLPEQPTESAIGTDTTETDGNDIDNSGDIDTETDGEGAAMDAEKVEARAPQIRIEATITDLSDEQKARFNDYVEWWNIAACSFYTESSVKGVDSDTIVAALRVAFIGEYIEDDDDLKAGHILRAAWRK